MLLENDIKREIIEEETVQKLFLDYVDSAIKLARFIKVINGVKEELLKTPVKKQ